MNWNPDQVVGLLNDAHARLDHLNDESHKFKSAYAEAKATYEVRHAQSTLGFRSDHTATDAKLAATVECEGFYRDMLIAKAVMDANATAINVLEKQVDLLRTLTVNARQIV